MEKRNLIFLIVGIFLIGGVIAVGISNRDKTIDQPKEIKDALGRINLGDYDTERFDDGDFMKLCFNKREYWNETHERYYRAWDNETQNYEEELTLVTWQIEKSRNIINGCTKWLSIFKMVCTDEEIINDSEEMENETIVWSNRTICHEYSKVYLTEQEQEDDLTIAETEFMKDIGETQILRENKSEPEKVGGGTTTII